VAATLLLVNTAVRENLALYSWLPAFIKTYVLGYGPAIFFIIASIFFIIQKNKDKKVVETGKTTPILSVSGPVLSPTPILAKPKKFYSKLNKSDLADALTNLSKILNKYGPDIAQRAHYIMDIWNLGINRIGSVDITNLIAELNEITNLVNNIYQNIYDNNGFLIENAAYIDELCHIVQGRVQPANNTCIPNNVIGLFRRDIKSFQEELATIKLAEKYDDRNLISSMIETSKANYNNFVNSKRIFEEWLNETQKRIVTFRNSELLVS
jgi:hypothetical protein